MIKETASSQPSSTPSFAPIVEDGQNVKIIGLGGVGGIVAKYGCIFLASTGADIRVVLVDGDSFERKNASRMLFSTCGPKANMVREDLLKHFAQSKLTIDAIPEFVTPDNISRLIVDGDVVLLTVDNHATRKLVSDYCAGENGPDSDWAGLENVILFSGGNDGVGPDAAGKVRHGVYGNCQIFARANRQNLCPTLTRHHREIRQPLDKLPTEIDCVEMIESTPQILFANLTAATCILNAMWLHFSGNLHYSEIAFDISKGLMRPLPYPGPALQK